MHCVRLASAVIVIGFLSACVSNTTPPSIVADYSLLTGEPCQPPCWQGLTPGASTESDVLNFVQNNPLVAGNVDSAHPSTWWWAGEKHIPERINFFAIGFDGKLEEIDIVPNVKITIADVLDAHHLPEKITIARRCFDSGGKLGYNLHLYYPKSGFVISWAYDDANVPNCAPLPLTVCPAPNQPASLINYYSLDLAQTLSDNYPLDMSNNLGITVYAGSSLATHESGAWSVNCLEIRQ